MAIVIPRRYLEEFHFQTLPISASPDLRKALSTHASNTCLNTCLYTSLCMPIYMYGRINLLVSLLGKLRAEPGLTLNAISVSINAANAAAVTPNQ